MLQTWSGIRHRIAEIKVRIALVNVAVEPGRNEWGRCEVLSVFRAETWPRRSQVHYRIRAQGFRALETQYYLDARPGNRPQGTAWVIRDHIPVLRQAPTFRIEGA